MPAQDEHPSPETLARLGAEVFELRVRPALRPDDDGKFVALDIATGGYEVDDDDYTAVARLRARLPAAEVWLERAGHPTAYQIRLARRSGVPSISAARPSSDSGSVAPPGPRWTSTPSSTRASPPR